MKITRTFLTTATVGFSAVCLLLVLFNSPALAGQVWEQRYDGPGHASDLANAVVLDSAGNAIVTGYSLNANGDADYYTVKYSAANGHLLWEQRYDSPSH